MRPPKNIITHNVRDPPLVIIKINSKELEKLYLLLVRVHAAGGSWIQNCDRHLALTPEEMPFQLEFICI